MNRQAARRKFHYIYKITRTDTGRFYIGMHSTDDLDDGYFGSGKLITASIKKHGKEKHTKEILEFLPTREALKLREKELVNEELISDKFCMNLRLGGEGGGGFSKACLALGGQSKTKNMSEEQIANYYKRLGALGGKVSGKINGPKTIKFATAKAWSETARNKRLTTYEKINHQKGEANSQFGTCWVCNSSIVKKVNKETLDFWLNQGFKRGRKFR
jgi:hypothetical protein